MLPSLLATALSSIDRLFPVVYFYTTTIFAEVHKLSEVRQHSLRTILSLCFQGEQTAFWRHCNSAFYCHHSSALQLWQTTHKDSCDILHETGTVTLADVFQEPLIFVHFTKVVNTSDFFKCTCQFAASLPFLPDFSFSSKPKLFVLKLLLTNLSTYHNSPLQHEYCTADISKIQSID